MLFVAMMALHGPVSKSMTLAGGAVVSVTWTYGEVAYSSGSVTVSYRKGKVERTREVVLPKDAWLIEDASPRPPVMLTKTRDGKEAVLDLTMPEESGVYGYSRVDSYRIMPGSSSVFRRVGAKFEFADFGAWRRVSDREVEYWDYIFADDESHQGTHRYRWTRVRQGSKGNKVLWTKETKGKYAFNWYQHLDADDLEVPAKDDPLRELGSRWSWWGQGVGQR